MRQDAAVARLALIDVAHTINDIVPHESKTFLLVELQLACQLVSDKDARLVVWARCVEHKARALLVLFRALRSKEILSDGKREISKKKKKTKQKNTTKGKKKKKQAEGNQTYLLHKPSHFKVSLSLLVAFLGNFANFGLASHVLRIESAALLL